jgi:hypothetical protein
LNPEHPEGRHKALVFQSTLGLTIDDSDLLRDVLLAKAVSEEVVLGKADNYGQRYRLDFVMTTGHGEARIRSAWIVRHGETIPRFLTCYVIE